MTAHLDQVSVCKSNLQAVDSFFLSKAVDVTLAAIIGYTVEETCVWVISVATLEETKQESFMGIHTAIHKVSFTEIDLVKLP